MRKLLFLSFLVFAFWPARAQAQIATLVQECNTGATTTSCSLTSLAANHTLVSTQDCLNTCPSFNSSPPTESFGLTWTRSVNVCSGSVVGANIDFQNIWYASTGSHTGNLTVTPSTGTRFSWVREYNAILVEDISACNTSASPPADSGAFVTTVASDLVVTLFYGTGFTSPTNFTLCCADSAAGFFGGDATLGAPGTYHVTGTTSSKWLINVVALKLSAAVGALTPRPWVINMNGGKHRRIPWDDRRRKLEIVKA